MVKTVKRFENWPALLSQYLKEREHMAFQWGYHDCMQFVSRGGYALTGIDFFTKYSTYNDEAGAKRVLEENGGVTGIITACIGPPHKNYLLAGRGDLVVFKGPELTAGLVDDTGQRIAAISIDRKMIRIPLSEALRVWSY